MEDKDKRIRELEVQIESLTKTISTQESLIKDLDSQIKAYESFGSPDQIGLVYDKMEDHLNKMAVLGKPEVIEAALDQATAVIEAYQALGTVDEIRNELSQYHESIDRIQSEQLSSEFKISIDTIKDIRPNFESWDALREHLNKVMTGRGRRTTTDKDVDVGNNQSSFSRKIQGL